MMNLDVSFLDINGSRILKSWSFYLWQQAADSKLYDQLFELTREKEIFLWMLAIHKFTLVSLGHKKVIQQQMRNAKHLERLSGLLRASWSSGSDLLSSRGQRYTKTNYFQIFITC